MATGMEILTGLLGLCLGSGLTAWLGWRRQAALAQSEQSLRLTLENRQARLDEIEHRLSQAESSLERQSALTVEAQTALARTATERDLLQTQLAEWKTTLETQWQQQFEAFLLKQLDVTRTHLTGEHQTTFQQHQEQFEGKIQTLLKPLNEMLATYREEMTRLDRNHLETATGLKEQIAHLSRVGQRLTETLAHNKGRGDWGEMELIGLLNDAGLIEGIHYDTQVAISNAAAGRLRPDIRVHLPNQRCVLIDAKTLQMTLIPDETADGETPVELTEATLAPRLVRAMREAVRSLGNKAYQAHVPNAADFVVLYAPREWMLSLALAQEPGLFEEAYRKNVVLCGPLNLIGLLKIVHLGWSRHQLSENAQQILTLGQELHKRAVKFAEQFAGVDKTLAKLNEQVTDAWTSLNGRQGLLKQTAKLEEYGCKSAKALPALESALAGMGGKLEGLEAPLLALADVAPADCADASNPMAAL